MKILALVTDGFGASGGIGQYNRDLALTFSQNSRVRGLAVVSRFGNEKAARVAGINQGGSHAHWLPWSLTALRKALQMRPDVIFCGHLYAAPLAALVARSLSIPLWLQLHGTEAWTAKSPTVRRASETATLVTSVSRYTRSRFLEWCNISPTRVKVLSNTFTAATEKPTRPSALAADLGLSGRRVILTVGRLSAAERYKGQDRIIAALPAVLAQHPDAIYLVVGSGDDRARLSALAQTTAVADKVIFASDVSVEQLPDYYALADVFVMPSTGEGFGIVFLEAAALGIPVIGGSADGSADALADGRIGRMIDPCDVAAIADAINLALAGKQPCDRSAVERFSQSNFENHVDALLRSFGQSSGTIRS